ncbi:hypothetical protein KEM48_005888, partial [Puccinia striiformis f. sp. tritici PST-130]
SVRIIQMPKATLFIHLAKLIKATPDLVADDLPNQPLADPHGKIPLHQTSPVALPTAPAPVSKSPAPPLAQPKVLIAAKGCKGKVPVKVKAPKGHTQAPIIPGNATDGRRRSTRLSEA